MVVSDDLQLQMDQIWPGRLQRMSAHLTTHREVKTATVQTGATALSECTLLSNPCHHWRGFFVGYSVYFGFFGYRQTPTRAGAPMMPE
jgi:hypothetical protein